MKKLFILIATVMLVASVFAQAPQKMSYQAVIRNSSDALVRNTQVGMQISILQGSANGAAVYTETQRPTTNANGLVSIEIGVGTVVSGDFTTIDWANGTYFIKTETDPAGGTSYTIAGVSQLLSVPYALHAKTAETVTGGITETDPTFTSSQAANITATDITNLGNLSGVNTGDQDLSTLATKAYVDALLARIEALEESDVLNNGFIDSRDGNEYNWVQIGDQVWMAENLAYLPEVVHSNDEFKTQSSNGQPGYGIYGYDGNDVATAKLQSNYTTYGVLYNWYAAMNGAESSMANPSGVQGVCPDGWHLPSDDEWHELIDNLGGRIIAGGALKAIGTVEAGTGLWYEPNAEATNETGFTALPGGFRNRDGGFGSDDGVTTLGYIGYTGHWWSTTVLAPLGKTVLPQFMSSGFGGTNGSTFDKGLGFSVRCIRD